MSIKEFKSTHDYICSHCSIYTWNSQPLILEVDHIDGNNQNNIVSNLRYLCPNCHSQTDTWRGRNIKNRSSAKVTDDQLIASIKSTKNIRQALIKVGLTPKGANYNRVSKLMGAQNIQTNNSQYGTIWVNNGKINKKIASDMLDDYIECGYTKGRLIKTSPPSQKGKIWITNGLKNKLVFPTDIPNGYWKGKFHKK